MPANKFETDTQRKYWPKMESTYDRNRWVCVLAKNVAKIIVQVPISSTCAKQINQPVSTHAPIVHLRHMFNKHVLLANRCG